jgi:hypothetical protein
MPGDMPPEQIALEHKGYPVSKAQHWYCVFDRTLVSPSNPGQISSACQVACRQSGVLPRLEDILLASGIPADVLTETINTIGRRGHVRIPTKMTCTDYALKLKPKI